MAILRNVTTGTAIATRIDYLNGFVRRFIGLLDRPSIQPGEGVWITSCGAIHTLGMRFPIDVVFVDRDGFVLRICPNVRPNRLVLSCRGARAVVEFGGGMVERPAVTVGDRLELISGVGKHSG